MNHQWAGRTSRTAMALRGVLAVLVVVAVSVLAVLSGSGGVFTTTPTVTSRIPASAGPVNAESPVRYRGVVVGKLAAVDADESGARLTLRIDEEHLGRIPAGVRTRIVPRTLFGDQFVQLAQPEQRARTSGAGTEMLAGGSTIPADTSRGTVQMYDAYTRLHSLLATLRPAQFQAALTTVADVLRGRGEQIGETIDVAHRLTAEFPADEVGENLGEVADLSQQLADSAPDVLATLDNAVAMSRMVVEERKSITSLLSAGTELAGTARRMMETHVPRAIEVVHTFRPVSEVLEKHPGQVTETLEEFDEFVRNANRTFRDDRFHIRAPVTLEDPHPYTPEECPRYPGLDGPHCAEPGTDPPREFGGTAGPVGSEQEREALVEMAPSALGPDVAEPNPDVLGVLFGPIARGTQVVVP